MVHTKIYILIIFAYSFCSIGNDKLWIKHKSQILGDKTITYHSYLPKKELLILETKTDKENQLTPDSFFLCEGRAKVNSQKIHKWSYQNSSYCYLEKEALMYLTSSINKPLRVFSITKNQLSLKELQLFGQLMVRND